MMKTNITFLKEFPLQKRFIFSFFFLILVLFSAAQTIGDYQSAGTGGWNTLASWKYYSASGWVTPSGIYPQGYPGQFSGIGSVLIQAGHTISINGAITTSDFGPLTISGALNLNGDNSPGGLDFVLNTTTVVVTPALVPKANINFINKVNLKLPDGASLQVSTGGLIGDCSNNQDIYIGSVVYSYCKGGGNIIPNFADLMAGGGTLTAIPSSNSPVCGNYPIDLIGSYSGVAGKTTPNGSVSGVNYNWSIISGPGGTISSSNSQSATIINPNIGTYSLNLTCSTYYGVALFTHSKTFSVVVRDLPAVPGVGVITQPTCTVSTGSIVLNGLPTAGTWTILRNGTSSGIITGSGASTTLSGLPVGTYNFKVSNGFCTSLETANLTINSATTIYTGAWSNGLPNNNLNIVIQSGTYNTSGNNISACNCEVKSGATLIIGGNSFAKFENNITNSGNIIVESEGNLMQVNDSAVNIGDIQVKRDTKIGDPRNQYNFLGTPVAFRSGESYHTIYPGSTTTVLYHNQTSNTFGTSSGVNIPGRGSAVKEPTISTNIPLASTTTTAIYKGIPQNGNITIPVSNSNPNPLVTTYGYNLLGNPYPSNIDLMKLYELNGGKTGLSPIVSPDISATFYFWNNNGNLVFQQQGNSYSGQAYAIFNVLSGVNGTGTSSALSTKVPTNIVKVGQGFMTRALVSSYVFKYNNSIRTNAASAVDFLGKESSVQEDRYWLHLNAPSGINATLAVVYFPNGHDTFGAEDSRSMGGSDAIYTMVEDEKVAINGRSSFQNTDVLPLGTQYFVSGNYTIGLDEVEGVFANGQNIYLKDTQTGIVTDLSQANYTFAANAGESTGRFEIIYQPATTLSTATGRKEEIVVYKDAQEFVIKAQSKKITEVEVYDASGRLMLKIQPNSLKVNLSANQMGTGIYILKINQDEQTTVKKIIR